MSQLNNCLRFVVMQVDATNQYCLYVLVPQATDWTCDECGFESECAAASLVQARDDMGWCGTFARNLMLFSVLHTNQVMFLLCVRTCWLGGACQELVKNRANGKQRASNNDVEVKSRPSPCMSTNSCIQTFCWICVCYCLYTTSN